MSTYVWEFKANNKVCKGLTPIAEDYTAVYAGKLSEVDFIKKLDPENLALVTEDKPYPSRSDMAKKDVPSDFADTEDGAMHICR